jgi:alpha-tubulin suppressor-like RCC1 family protein
MNNTISYRGSIKRDGSIIGIKGSNFVSVSACKDSLCALSRDGHISGFNITPPKGVFVSISIGPNYSLALTIDGRVVAWGNYLCLRRLTTDTRKHFVAIATGSEHSVGLTNDGQIVGCGYYSRTECPSGNNFVAIAAGENHSLALTRDGCVVGWGDDNYGQCDCPSGNNFVAIAAGQFHSLALTRQGRIVQWGGSYTDIRKPKGSKFVAIYAYKNHFLALTQNGRIVKWGEHSRNSNIECSKEKYAMPYDYLSRLNSGLKTLCNMPKYIKMEILEDYTGWTFGNLYYLAN